MEAIGRSSRFLAVLVLLVGFGALARADESAELRERLLQVANAISAGNPSDAMSAFSKTFKDYDKLRDYFSWLSHGFKLESEVDFLDDPSEGPAPELNVHWILTLAEPETNYSSRRAADIKVRFVREKNKWKIAEFAPIDLFNPTQQTTATSTQTSSHSSL